MSKSRYGKFVIFILSFFLVLSTNPAYSVSSKTVNTATTSKYIKSLKIKSSTLYLKSLSKIAAQSIGIKGKRKSFYSGLSKTQVKNLVYIKAAFGDKLYPLAAKVAWCESRLNNSATNFNTNKTFDYGLFQLNSGGTMQRFNIDPINSQDPMLNAKAAKALFDDRGWQPWGFCGKSVTKL